jgi:hypothetical protein
MKKIFFLLLLFASPGFVFSQGNMKTKKWRKTEVDSLNRAQLLFEEQNFDLALPIFQRIQQNHPKELYLKYVAGIAGLYRSDTHGMALDFLSQVYEKNKKAQDIEYDLARAMHYNYKFDEALVLMDKYLQKKALTEKQVKYAKQLVEYCNNAKKMVAAPVDAKIDNIGEIVNTVSSEYVPVVSSDESVMIFTYVGDQSTGGTQNAFNQPDPAGGYYEDVFITHKEGNEWVQPSGIGTNINSNLNDAAIAISNDGQKLFIFKDDGTDGGDIYISKLDGENWSSAERLKGGVNTSAWEGSASLSADEKTLFFASEMSGGLGGRDLYQATLKADGTWGNIRNMGPGINSAFDDDAPFIHPNGQTLLYSSKGRNSMGDYDIFMTHFNPKDSSWSLPENIGYPINTPDDDRYLVLSADGERGYYASGKEGGFGLQDIYMVDMPSHFVTPGVVLVKGKITLDDKPVNASVVVTMTDNGQEYGRFSSNATDGDYLVNLMFGHKYEITYALDSFPVQKQTLDASEIANYLEKTFDIKFSTKVDSSMIPKDTTALKPTIAEVVEKLGDATKDGLEFKVQIAAYNLPKNYKYDHLNGLGNVEKLLLDDGITRFTIGGSFNTLNLAIQHKTKVISAGQTDAFVTAIYKGKRVYLEELEKLGLIPPQPK